MNVLQDGTGWILPTRCASRWTASLLWKYGLVRFTEHSFLPDERIKKVVMNVRDPIDRLGSFFRLIQASDHLNERVRNMTIEEYVENLYTAEIKPRFTNAVVFISVEEEIVPYPVPLFKYVDMLGRLPDHFVRVEHMDEDLEAAGYPVRDHVWKQEKEPDLDFSYDDMKNNQRLVDVALGIYARDLEYVYGD